ncbi:MAG: hypothetical protein CMG25_04020 [Candidatus Marinimicrobia bacterium]|nr:hypothetical protein [Candidatus Neomarinimicrobiota bacterium]|tara:strand:- start:10319 stop:11101 length:783 start_codon:yes stop_codon:yes gene_type:complete
MKMTIRYNSTTYNIDSNTGIDISIPVNFNENLNPKFYDTSYPQRQYYKEGNREYNIKKGAGCNVPMITMNIHCSGTHTETANHIINDAPMISDIDNLNFIPSQLISVNPEINSNEKYHADSDNEDRVITKNQLEKLINPNTFTESIIIRTNPNDIDKKIKNYNSHHHPYLSNEAIEYLKEIKVKHIVIDTPSIDKYNDGGKLGNHKIFFTNNDNSTNHNTVTELVFIPNECIDGKYFLCIGVPNFKLDAAPSKPIIYKVN